jgi:hypothetical protein
MRIARPLTEFQPAFTLSCPQCGVLDKPVVGPGSGPHAAAARCRHCGRFLKWLTTYTPGKRQPRRQQGRQQAMTARPPSVAPLVYLVVLGDVDPVLSTMAETSVSMRALVRGEGQP